ncbi:MAG: isopentenyl-diphosphate Delta-isomerase [Flavobacteriales bacterium]
MEEQVILVDDQDKELGVMNKMEAHEKGVLHRAFSVFLFNDQDELLLQRRALEKYHSPGLWTNTCCSHPRKGETTLEAAHRRLKEEMGISTALEPKFTFLYKAVLDRGLTEHELDHVFMGSYNNAPSLNSEEAVDWKYISIPDLLLEVKTKPDSYTEWFKICLDQVVKNQLKT